MTQNHIDELALLIKELKFLLHKWNVTSCPLSLIMSLSPHLLKFQLHFVLICTGRYLYATTNTVKNTVAVGFIVVWTSSNGDQYWSLLVIVFSLLLSYKLPTFSSFWLKTSTCKITEMTQSNQQVRKCRDASQKCSLWVVEIWSYSWEKIVMIVRYKKMVFQTSRWLSRHFLNACYLNILRAEKEQLQRYCRSGFYE